MQLAAPSEVPSSRFRPPLPQAAAAAATAASACVLLFACEAAHRPKRQESRRGNGSLYMRQQQRTARVKPRVVWVRCDRPIEIGNCRARLITACGVAQIGAGEESRALRTQATPRPRVRARRPAVEKQSLAMSCAPTRSYLPRSHLRLRSRRRRPPTGVSGVTEVSECH